MEAAIKVVDQVFRKERVPAGTLNQPKVANFAKAPQKNPKPAIPKLARVFFLNGPSLEPATRLAGQVFSQGIEVVLPAQLEAAKDL